MMTTSGRSHTELLIRLFFLVVLGVSTLPVMAETWLPALETALRLKEQGYSYRALRQVEALRRQYPDNLRLKLEAASLYLDTGDPERASQLVDEVLDSSTLPVSVRINAQVLQLDALRAQQASPADVRATVALNSGYEEVERSLYHQISGAVQLGHSPGPANLAGRAVPLRLSVTANGLSRRYWVRTAQSSRLLDLETALQLGSPNVSVTPAFGYRFYSPSGYTLSLDAELRRGDWTFGQNNQWLSHNRGWNRDHDVSARYRVRPAWWVQLQGRHRVETDNGNGLDTRTDIGVGQVAGRAPLQFTTDIGYRSDTAVWSLESALNKSLGRRWRLRVDLGSHDIGDAAHHWFTGVTLRWTR